MQPHLILTESWSWNSKKIEFYEYFTAKKYRKMDWDPELPHFEGYILFSTPNYIKDVFWKADWWEFEWRGMNKHKLQDDRASFLEQWLGWSNKYQNSFFFSLGRIARWNCMHLTSIYQIWIYFLITKVFHVTGRIGNYRKNHQLKNQNEQLLIFFQSLSFFFRYIHSAYKILILLFICLYSDIWNNITQYFLMFSL